MHTHMHAHAYTHTEYTHAQRENTHACTYTHIQREHTCIHIQRENTHAHAFAHAHTHKDYMFTRMTHSLFTNYKHVYRQNTDSLSHATDQMRPQGAPFTLMSPHECQVSQPLVPIGTFYPGLCVPRLTPLTQWPPGRHHPLLKTEKLRWGALGGREGGNISSKMRKDRNRNQSLRGWRRRS